MKTYKLNNKESKSLLESAEYCIGYGMVSRNYEVEKTGEIIEDVYELNKSGKGIEVEIEVKIKDKAE